MRIKKIKVKKLHGYLDKEIDFFDDENYLIGINGSGKSSVIKILEAFFSKQEEYFKKLEFNKIEIVTTENTYRVYKEISMSDGEVWPIAIYNKKMTKIIVDRKIKELLLKLEESKEGEKSELLKEINDLKENEQEYCWKTLEKSVDEEGQVVCLNLKTPNLDLNIFEHFFKKDNTDNVDTIENILLEINPVRNLKKTLNDIGKRNLQYCRAVDELVKIRLAINEKIGGENLAEEIENLKKSEFEIKQKAINNRITSKKVDEFIEVINEFLIDSHKRIEFDTLEGNFFMYIISKNLQKLKKIDNYNFLSSGERNLLSLITKVYFIIEEDSILLIDEPEESLHIAWQQKIIPAIKRAIDGKNIQVIVATHAPNLTGKMIELSRLIPIYPYNLEEK